ncbi:hypothetical protein ROZALSC1DRAFT_25469 [Rozella allomycis CSF55]|uniref:Uncharacterized protein n=1 Tax=Rozella allomycis (strain CSF55) TaxID=988480 RepID=A0A4P9YCE9_ROZAC|nr:hypothetical protein ROZALSC1DRAFT_25469 [Rozella allomycis CSF55]
MVSTTFSTALFAVFSSLLYYMPFHTLSGFHTTLQTSKHTAVEELNDTNMRLISDQGPYLILVTFNRSDKNEYWKEILISSQECFDGNIKLGIAKAKESLTLMRKLRVLELPSLYLIENGLVQQIPLKHLRGGKNKKCISKLESQLNKHRFDDHHSFSYMYESQEFVQDKKTINPGSLNVIVTTCLALWRLSICSKNIIKINSILLKFLNWTSDDGHVGFKVLENVWHSNISCSAMDLCTRVDLLFLPTNFKWIFPSGSSN